MGNMNINKVKKSLKKYRNKRRSLEGGEKLATETFSAISYGHLIRKKKNIINDLLDPFKKYEIEKGLGGYHYVALIYFFICFKIKDYEIIERETYYKNIFSNLIIQISKKKLQKLKQGGDVSFQNIVEIRDEFEKEVYKTIKYFLLKIKRDSSLNKEFVITDLDPSIMNL